MNCEFCGSPSLNGATLCAACRSALKRARHEPVSVLDALQKSKSAMRRRGKLKEATVLKPPGMPPPRRRGPAPAVVGGILAILCLLTYGLLQHLDGSARAGLPAQAAANLPVETSQPNPSPASPAMSAAEPAPASVSEAPLPAEPTESMPDNVEPLPIVPPRAVAPRPKRKALPPPPAPVVVEVAPTVPAPAPIAAPPPKPAPPPSRETQLSNAFAACTSADALEKAICQQRARVDLCEGYWGLVPQCPARRESGS